MGFEPLVLLFWLLLTFMIPLLYILLFHSVLSEKRRIACEDVGTRWSARNQVDQNPGWGLGFLSDLATGIAVFLSVAVLDFLVALLIQLYIRKEVDGVDLFLRNNWISFTLLFLGMAADRFFERRFVFAATTLAWVFTCKAVALGVTIGQGDWLSNSQVIRIILVSISSWFFAALFLAGTLRLALRLTPSSQDGQATSPTSQQQFRYIKATVSFVLLAALVFFFEFQLVRWSEILNGIEFLIPEVDVAIENRASSITHDGRIFLTIGISWILAIPVIIGGFCFLGLFFVQDITREKWHDRIQKSMKERHAQRFAYTLVDEYAAGVSLITSTFHRHPLQFGVGLSVNVIFSLSGILYSQAAPLSEFGMAVPRMPNSITIVNMWIGSALLWFAPLAQSLTEAHQSFKKGITQRVKRSLARAEGHVVVAGYGDLGRRVVSVMFQRRILDLSHYRDTTDVILPDGHRGFLLEGLVIVEKNPALFVIRDDSSGLEVGLIRVSVPDNLLQPREKGPLLDLRWGPAGEREVFAVGICGDINDEHVLSSARIPFASHYVCLARDLEAALTSADFLRSTTKRSRVRSLIAAQSSSVPAFLGYRSILHPIVFEHLSLLRAAPMARATGNSIEAIQLARSVQGKPINILFCGSGLEVFYVIDALLRYCRFDENSPIILGVVSCEDGLHSRVDDAASPIPNIKGWKRLHFHPHIARALDSRVMEQNRRMSFSWFFGDPASDAVLLRAIEGFEPDAIVVIDPRVLEQLRILKAVVQGVGIWTSDRANGNPRIPPRLIVGAETGMPGRSDSVGDGFKYAYFRDGKDELDGPFFPRRAGFTDHQGHQIIGDGLVDVLQDPAHRIASVVHAFSMQTGNEAGSYSHPMEISLCVQSQPGALAGAISDLCGLEEVELESTTEKVDLAGIPTLRGTRMYILDEDKLFVETTASLVAPELSSGKNRSAVARASILGLGAERATIESFRRRALRGLDEAGRSASPDKSKWWCDGCPDMTGCKVAATRRTAEARLVDSPTSTMAYFVAPNDHQGPGTSDPILKTRVGARMVLLAGDGEQAGTLARILKTLVFEEAHAPTPRTDSKAIAKRSETFPGVALNLAYASDEPCHGSGFSVVTLYGALVRARRPDSGFPLESVLLRPMAGERQWTIYFMALRDHVQAVFEKERSGTAIPRINVFVVRRTRSDEIADKNIAAHERGATIDDEILLYWLSFQESDAAYIQMHLKRPGRCLNCKPESRQSWKRRLCRELRAGLHGLDPDKYLVARM